MKTASTAAIAAIHSRSRNFRMKLVFSGFEVTTMEYFSTNTLSCSSSGLTFGTAAIGAGEFKVKKDTNDFADKEFTAYVGILVNDVREWVKIGKYHITEVEVNGIEKTVSFEDDIAKLDKTFTEKLTYPVTAQTILGKIATLCGVTFDMTAIPSSLKVTYDYTDVSCRTIVSQIAQMVGTFVAYDSSADKIAFKWYTNTNYIIKKSDTASENKLYMIDEPEIGEQFCLDMLVCNTGTETFTSSVDNATGILSFTNPMMTQAQLNSLFVLRKGFTYNEGRVTFKLGNPLLDVWDIVTVEYMDKTAVFPCMNVNFTYTGGITANIQTYVKDKDTAFEGQITKEFREVKTQITAVDGKVSSKVSKGDIISEINQSAEKVQIKAEKIELDGETIADKLTASSAKIGGWTIKDSKIYAGDGTTIKTAAVQAPASNNMWVFAAGGSTHDTYNDCPFRVDRYGRLYCTQVTATGGKVGGFSITENTIYSGTKSAINSTEQGIYLGNDGQFAIGDNTGYIRYYKDSDNKYKLKIAANSITFSDADIDVETAINTTVSRVDNLEERADSGEFKGEWVSEGWVDASSYSESLWIPFDGSAMPNNTNSKIEVVVNLNSGTKPSWGTHASSGFSVNFVAETIGRGWGANKYEPIILKDVMSFVNGESPVSLQQVMQASKPVLYLRGGGKYYVRTTFPCTWTGHPSGYTWSNAAGTTTANFPTSTTRPPYDGEPYSTQSETEEAAKVATNYMNFDTNGLVIGNMTASTLGNNVLIDNDSVDIRNGNTVLASYSANTIYLGKNGENTTIDMCNSAGTIKASNSVWGTKSLLINSQDETLFTSSGDIALKTTYGTNVASVNVFSRQQNSYQEHLAYVYISAVNSGYKASIYIGDSSVGSAAGVTISCGDKHMHIFDGMAMAYIDGTYDTASWNVGIDGSLLVYDDISVCQTGKDGFTSLCYKTGDSISYNAGIQHAFHGAGYITNSGTFVYFSIPLGKTVIGNPTVSVTSIGGITVRQDNKYLYGSTAGTTGYAKPLDYGAWLAGDGSVVVVRAMMGSTTNVTNNSCCGIEASIKITFS